VKYLLIVVAAAAGLVATLVSLAIFTHIFDDHERVGHFDIYRTPKAADSSVHSELYYKRHRISERLDGYSIDPNSPDRIVFFSDDHFSGEGRCGEFLYDDRTGQMKRLRRWPAFVAWSPDSWFMLLERDHPTILDLATDREVDLTDAVSAADGKRMELQALQLSPDGKKLAAVVMVAPNNQVRDGDLAEITIESLSVRYIATIRGHVPDWTEKDIAWRAGRLELAFSGTPRRPVIVKAPEKLGWLAIPPTAPPKPAGLDIYCPSMEPKSR
jgi:hypothetical protein